MAEEWSWVNSAISASAGLGGVWLGGWLTSRREARLQRDRLQREAHYLAALVVAHLDRFADGCLPVACDDGTTEGRPAGDDGQTHQTIVSPPTFEPLELEVDWKVLPPALMADILQLPFRVEQLEHNLEGIWQFDAAPDYSDFFWARQERYAELGLEVSGLAQRLRSFAGLPVLANEPGEWNRDQGLKEQRDKIRAERQRYEERLAAHADIGKLVVSSLS
jgi:hypothetical protein